MKRWLDEPEEHDYPAAISYLTLMMPCVAARAIVEGLRVAPMTAFKAKDIFRASGLPLLGLSNLHVKQNLKKMRRKVKLSPLLLGRTETRLIVADGYHRLCAVYRESEDEVVPCKIVG